MLALISLLTAGESQKEFRISLGGQVASNTFLSSELSDRFTNHSTGRIDTFEISYSQITANFITAEIGLATSKGHYFGIYGEIPNVGATFVYLKEFLLKRKLIVSLGLQAGVIFQNQLNNSYTITHKGVEYSDQFYIYDYQAHEESSGDDTLSVQADFGEDQSPKKFGGPDIRATFGNKRVRFTIKSVLWVGQFYDDILEQRVMTNGSMVNLGYSLGTKFGISPSIGVSAQFNIPRS